MMQGEIRRERLLQYVFSAIIVGIVAFVMSLTSCQKIDTSDASASSSIQQAKNVQFVVKGITEEYSTRATIQSVGMTDLWVFEGSTLLKHQVSTDSDFGTPTLSLTYGSHDITFIASKADGQSFTTQWKCTKVKETFATQMNVTVSGGSSTSRQVELKRRSAQVCFHVEDAIPSTVKKMHLTVGNNLSLTSALAGGDAVSYDATIDVSSLVGTVGYKPAVNVLTASATDAEDVAVMVEFLSADNAALYHYERTVSVKPNRVTYLKGSYFSGEANAVSVKEAWEDNLVVPL